jgi:hypothetical protein
MGDLMAFKQCTTKQKALLDVGCGWRQPTQQFKAIALIVGYVRVSS